MTVADMSTANQNAVGPTLKSSQDVMRRNRSRTHNSYGTNIRSVLHPTDTSQIGGPVGAPVAQESNYFRSEFYRLHGYLLVDYLLLLDAHDQIF